MHLYFPPGRDAIRRLVGVDIMPPAERRKYDDVIGSPGPAPVPVPMGKVPEGSAVGVYLASPPLCVRARCVSVRVSCRTIICLCYLVVMCVCRIAVVCVCGVCSVCCVCVCVCVCILPRLYVWEGTHTYSCIHAWYVLSHILMHT